MNPGPTRRLLEARRRARKRKTNARTVQRRTDRCARSAVGPEETRAREGNGARGPPGRRSTAAAPNLAARRGEETRVMGEANPGRPGRGSRGAPLRQLAGVRQREPEAGIEPRTESPRGFEASPLRFGCGGEETRACSCAKGEETKARVRIEPRTLNPEPGKADTWQGDESSKGESNPGPWRRSKPHRCTSRVLEDPRREQGNRTWDRLVAGLRTALLSRGRSSGSVCQDCLVVDLSGAARLRLSGACPPACLFVRSVRPSVCLSVCVSVCLSVSFSFSVGRSVGRPVSDCRSV